MAKQQPNQRLSEILLNKRQERRLTLRQVAYKSGLSATYISELERGLRNTPSPERLRSLSDALGIGYDTLMKEAGYIDEPKRELNDPNGLLMFSDQEAFNSLPEAEQNRILSSLRDQADYLIDKAKRGK